MTKALEDVLVDARALLSRPENDFTWSSWRNAETAILEMDELLASVRSGEVPRLILKVIFTATGPMSEVAVSSGWGQDWVDLGARFDAALAEIPENG